MQRNCRELGVDSLKGLRIVVKRAQITNEYHCSNSAMSCDELQTTEN